MIERVHTRRLSSQAVGLTEITASREKQTAPLPTPLHTAWKLTFFIDNELTTSIRLALTDPLLIGRADPVEGYMPGFDLSSWGAQDKGVSRRHAQIASLNNEIYICDLGSVNGTRINGTKLPPNHTALLRNGDIIECGRMRMVLYAAPTD